MTVGDFLNSIVNLWIKQIEVCEKSKQEHFGKTAARAWSFVGKRYKDLYLSQDSDESKEFAKVDQPYRKTRLNKSAQYAAVFGAFLGHQVPARIVSPRRPQIPNEILELVEGVDKYQKAIEAPDTLRAWLMQWWLNYLPGESDLISEERRAIREALIKGMGVLWHEMIEKSDESGDNRRLLPASRFDSIDGLLIDGDCQQRRDAGFIVRGRERSVWQLAEEYDVDPTKLRGHRDSKFREGMQNSGHATKDNEDNRDVCQVYEVYSRIGFGHRLVGAGDDLKDITNDLDAFGPHVYLVLVPGVPYPLNLPPEVFVPATEAAGLGDELRERASWPIPFYDEFDNPWPCSILEFYPNTDNPYATSPLEPVLPLQQFLDNAYSFLMDRIAVTSKNILVVSKALEQQFKDGLVRAGDLELLFVQGTASDVVKDLISVLSFPEVNRDLWEIIAMVERAFEEGSGMDPLLLGGGHLQRQIRSAEEASIREAHASSRPHEFAQLTDNWMSKVAAKEGQASRLYVGPEIVAPLFGEPWPTDEETPPGPLTEAWDELVNTDDPILAAAELSYTVEAGTGQRKNKQKQINDAQMLTQTLLGPLLDFASTTGNTNPYNALMDVLGTALEIPMERLMLPPMQPQEAEESQNTE